MFCVMVDVDEEEDSEIEAIISEFVKEFAPRATHRKVLGEIKRKLHRDILISCEDTAIAPIDVEIVQAFYKERTKKNTQAKL